MSQTGRRYAILIGSSQFDQEPLRSQPLRCPERDVDGMHDLLSAAEFGAFGATFVFKNAESHVVIDRIEEVLAAATRDDQVLIYYSGHGRTDLPGRLYLTTPNTEIRKLLSTSIPVETLRQVMELSSCRRIILILDCCYGGAVGKSFTRGSVDEKLMELGRGHGIYILTASTAAQIAQEREGDDYGLLTKHIINGIKGGGAANDGGLVTMDGLYTYVYAQVTGEGHQEPMRWALNVKGEELIIARSSKTPFRERQRLLTEKLIEARAYLPPQLFASAIQVVQERRAPFYELVDELYRRRLPLGEFVEEWYRLESVTQQPPTQAPQVEEILTESVQDLNSSPRRAAQAHRRLDGAANAMASKLRSVQAWYFKLLLWVRTRLTDVHRVASSVGPKPTWKWIVGSAVGVLLIGLIYLFTSDSLLEIAPANQLPMPVGKVSSSPPPTLLSSPISRPKQTENFAENLNGVMLEMVYVPGGQFSMGTPEGNSRDEEHPQHEVTIPDFYVGRCEVTQAQWKAVMDGNNPAFFKGDDRLPVENISWNEAKQFCKKLSGLTSKEYRLPSEAEWEYACRAGTTGGYSGNIKGMAWYSWNSGSKTHPVGQQVPNAFGLRDMHGNVFEWCEDTWHPSYQGAPSDGSAWTLGGEEKLRILRGGSWGAAEVYCRSAYRKPVNLDVTNPNNGVRVVLSMRPR